MLNMDKVIYTYYLLLLCTRFHKGSSVVFKTVLVEF